ncbi:MAG: alpha/beta hydrolase [Arenicellaceae bacterium]|nr:alpha/beta hydrolase [Arenicellaceae bacterium]
MKRFWCCFIATLVLVVSLNLQAQEGRARQGQRAPVVLPEGTQEFRDISYVPDGHQNQKLDLFLPESGVSRPLIIYIHGGGFSRGSKAQQLPPASYLEKGYAVASLNYRLSQDAIFPAALEDVKTAVRWLRANADEYGVDPNRFAAWGQSAGSYFAIMLGVTSGVSEFEVGENQDVSSAVQVVLDNYGPTDFAQMDAHRLPGGQEHNLADSFESQFIGGALQENLEAVARANPITYISEGDAPMLVVHGDADPLVPHHQSEILVEALQAAGVEVEFYTVAGGGHGRFTDPKVGELIAMTLEEYFGQ